MSYIKEGKEKPQCHLDYKVDRACEGGNTSYDLLLLSSSWEWGNFVTVHVT